ncbi:MAG: hypothetical protein Q4D56_13515 [Bacteroides sp.]|nr:hypothetical protein [Bacteroides sp.]
MKKLLFILLLTSIAGIGRAQTVAVPDTLLFVFKLHGQTRKYQMSFREKQDTLYLHWGIERNLHWQSGSYAMSPQSVREGVRLSFLQPEDGKHVLLPSEETAYVLSRSAYRQLKEQHSFVYNNTRYAYVDASSTVLGMPLIHVRDEAEGGEMWILDYPALPLVWKMQDNPLEINWAI